MAKLPEKTGSEDPATSEHVAFNSKQDTRKPVAAMAGSFSRTIPVDPDGDENAGQDVAGDSEGSSEGGPIKRPSSYCDLKGY
jgi:hypothetical protein